MRLKRRRIFIFIFSLLICLSGKCSAIPDTSSCEYTLDPKWIEQIPHVLDKLLEHSPYISSVKNEMYADQEDEYTFSMNANAGTTIRINCCQKINFQTIDEFAVALAHEIGHLEDYAHQKRADRISRRLLPEEVAAVPEYRKFLESEKQTLQTKAKIIDIDAAKPYLSANEKHKETEMYADLRASILNHQAGFNPCADIILSKRKNKDGSAKHEYQHEDEYFAPAKRLLIITKYIDKKLGIKCS